jgi:hypothetical protein
MTVLVAPSVAVGEPLGEVGRQVDQGTQLAERIGHHLDRRQRPQVHPFSMLSGTDSGLLVSRRRQSPGTRCRAGICAARTGPLHKPGTNEQPASNQRADVG